jgi:hypothetical protein
MAMTQQVIAIAVFSVGGSRAELAGRAIGLKQFLLYESFSSLALAASRCRLR